MSTLYECDRCHARTLESMFRVNWSTSKGHFDQHLCRLCFDQFLTFWDGFAVLPAVTVHQWPEDSEDGSK